MFKISALFLIGLFSIASTTVIANEKFENKCANWAEEDNVSENEKPEYINECVQNLIEEQNERMASEMETKQPE